MTPGNVLQIQVSDLQEYQSNLVVNGGTLEMWNGSESCRLCGRPARLSEDRMARQSAGPQAHYFLSKMQKLGIACEYKLLPLTQEEASKDLPTAGKRSSSEHSFNVINESLARR